MVRGESRYTRVREAACDLNYRCIKCEYTTPDLGIACVHWAQNHYTKTDLGRKIRLRYICGICSFTSEDCKIAIGHQIDTHRARKGRVNLQGLAERRFLTTSPEDYEGEVGRIEKIMQAGSFEVVRSQVALYEDALTVGSVLGRRGEYHVDRKPVPRLLVRKQVGRAKVDLADMFKTGRHWTLREVVDRTMHISSAAGDIILWAVQILPSCNRGGVPGMPPGPLIYVEDKEMWYTYVKSMNAEGVSYAYWDPDPYLESTGIVIHDAALIKIGESFSNLAGALHAEGGLRTGNKEVELDMASAASCLLKMAESISDSYLFTFGLCEALRSRCSVTTLELEKLGEEFGVVHFLDEEYEGFDKRVSRAKRIRQDALLRGIIPAQALDSLAEYMGFVIGSRLMLLNPIIKKMKEDSIARAKQVYARRSLEIVAGNIRKRYGSI